MLNNKRTKIAHIITGLGMGGAERMLSNIVLNLDRDQFENVVISLRDLGHWGAVLQEQGITVHYLNMRPNLASLQKLTRLAQILREFQPDCIQGWMYHANLVATIAGTMLRIKRVYWNIRCSLMDLSKYKITTKMVFKMSALVARTPTAILNNSRSSILQHQSRGYYNKNLLYVPNGFDSVKFQPNPEIYARFRIEHNLPQDAVIIGIVARFDPMKDHATFLQAAAMLSKQKRDVYFVCAGTGINAYNQKIQRIIDANCLESRVILLDQVHDVQNLYPALDYLTQTSNFGEGFPNVVAEAMLSGLECFVTDVGESYDIVGTHGFKIAIGDPVGLAATWQAALQRNATEIQQQRTAARQRIIDNYSLENVCKLYGDIYKN